MPTVCGAISEDILANCDNKPIGGVDTTIYGIPLADWNNATLTFDAGNPLIINSIALLTGKKFFKFQVFKRGHKPKFEAVDTEFGVNYKHSIATNIPVYTDAVKAQIQALAEGYTVFIVENLQKSGVPFEIYGAQSGLRMPDLVRDLAANEGVITGIFTNDEDAAEPRPPYTFKTVTGTYASTKAAVTALTVAAS